MIWYIVTLILITIIFILYKKHEGMSGSYLDGSGSYLDGIDIIYWINLERSPERKNEMEKMFRDKVFQGIPNKRIIGIDGKKDNIYDMIYTSKYNSTDSEYGCFISHLNAIREFNTSEYNIALILEDDCTLEFKKYWTKSVKSIINDAPKDWEVIMLSYINVNNPLLTDWKGNDQTYINDHTWGTLSYIINKKGSKKIVDSCDSLSCYKNNIYTINPNIEHRSDSYVYLVAKTYCYKYPMFIYKTDNDSTIHNTDNDSTINNTHLGTHNQSKQLIINNYNKLYN